MADETPVISDPFIPPGLELPVAEPYSPVLQVPPYNQAPRSYRFDASAPAGLNLSIGSGEIQTQGPAFIRLNAIFDIAGVIFAPPVFAASSSPQSVWIAAWPKGWGPTGTQRLRQQGTVRGSGPLLWVPHAGTWIVEFTAERISTVTSFEITVVHSPPGYLGYLGSPAPTRHVVANGPILANTSIHIGTFLGLSTQTVPNWFAITGLRVKADNPLAGLPRISVGGCGFIGQGLILNSLTIHTYTWSELAGASIWLSNSDLAVDSQNIAIEAHFL